MRRADPTIAVALRVGLATAIALVGGGLLGYAEVAGFAALGALSSAFLRYEPYPRLAVRLPWVGVGLTIYTAFGAALGTLGASMWWQIVLLSIGAGLAYWVFTAFRITGPGPVILVFAAAGAAGYAGGWADVALATTAAAVGAVVGYIVAMAPALSHPHAPARIAVARALAAVSALETVGSRGVFEAEQSIDRARETIAFGTGRKLGPHARELLALLDAAESVLGTGWHDTPSGRREDFTRLETELRKVRRDIEIPRIYSDDAVVPSAPADLSRRGIDRLGDRLVWLGTGRITLASLLAAAIAAVLDLQHPLWASIGAMAALQGLNYRHTVQRAIQRLLGNVVGAVIAAVLLASDPGFWPMVVAIILFQTITEMFVTRNYGLASVAVTAMALLLTGLGEQAGPEIAANRIADTLIGVAVGVVVAAVTIRHDDRHHIVA